jgi:hypothetical protein
MEDSKWPYTNISNHARDNIQKQMVIMLNNIQMEINLNIIILIANHKRNIHWITYFRNNSGIFLQNLENRLSKH